VITWYVEKFQSELHPTLANVTKDGSSRTKATSDGNLWATIENNNEIAYLLRGIDQFGMLPYVGKIFIFLDRRVVTAHGAPRYVNWDHPKVKPIYTQDLGINGDASISAKLATFHLIPGISEWFLYLQDDILVANKFSPDLLFDGSKPRYWKGKDLWVTPPENCPTNGGPVLERNENEHMPWLVNKCYMELVEREYPDYFKSVRMDRFKKFSAQCTYDSWMYGHQLTSPSDDASNTYGVVCHLGTPWSQCPLGRDAAGPAALGALEAILEHPPVFLNLQGKGISDDYPLDYEVKDKALEWLHTYYKQSALTVAQ
jgi:hypothetical protein